MKYDRVFVFNANHMPNNAKHTKEFACFRGSFVWIVEEKRTHQTARPFDYQVELELKILLMCFGLSQSGVEFKAFENLLLGFGVELGGDLRVGAVEYGEAVLLRGEVF